MPTRSGPDIDPFRLQHMQVTQAAIQTEQGRVNVMLDESESPLAWLARRRGRDGRALIEPHQLLAGERLRADFTRAHMTPRTTSNWESAVRTEGSATVGAGHFTDIMIASRQRVQQALERVGPEFAGLLLDVCCFLKRLEDVERERAWPARSAKVVLQLALDRLARHYGYAAQVRGRRQDVRTWLAEDATFRVESG